MKYKAIVFCVFILGLSLTGYAQPDNIRYLKADTVKLTWLNRINVSGGVGISTGFLQISEPATDGVFFPVGIREWGTSSGEQEFSLGKASPEYGASVNYDINTRFSLGVAVGFQSIDMFYEFTPNLPFDYISRLNVMISSRMYLEKSNKYFNDYIGVKAGCSYWRDEVSSVNTLGSAIGTPYLYRFSFQLLYGLTLYPYAGPVGLNLEVGIGAPYLAQAGILFRI